MNECFCLETRVRISLNRVNLALFLDKGEGQVCPIKRTILFFIATAVALKKSKNLNQSVSALVLKFLKYFLRLRLAFYFTDCRYFLILFS